MISNTTLTYDQQVRIAIRKQEAYIKREISLEAEAKKKAEAELELRKRQSMELDMMNRKAKEDAELDLMKQAGHGGDDDHLAELGLNAEDGHDDGESDSDDEAMLDI